MSAAAFARSLEQSRCREAQCSAREIATVLGRGRPPGRQEIPARSGVRRNIVPEEGAMTDAVHIYGKHT
jgi:hypothetical protein